jgi:transposase-like protein
LQHVSEKYKKEFASDMKAIYHAPDDETGHKNIYARNEKQVGQGHPAAMKRLSENWDVVCPVSKALYTTNAIESLNPANTVGSIAAVQFSHPMTR